MPANTERIRAREFERRWKRAGSVLCDLWKRSKVEGGAAGDSFEPAVIATGIHCVFWPLSQSVQTVVGGRTVISSHGLELAKSDATEAITIEYLIKIPTRDLVFEQPVPTTAIDAATVRVNATLVQHGYKQ